MATCNSSTLLAANPFTELDPGLMEAVKLQLLCDISASGGGGGGGGVPTTRTISTTSPLQGGGDLSANRTFSILQASGSQNGFLSSTDWTTFNGKIGGSGTSGTFARFSASGTITDSAVLTESAGLLSSSGPLSFTGTTHAGLRVNNLTTAQRDAIVSPAAGMLVWNTTTTRLNAHNGSIWMDGFVRLSGDTMTGALGITQGTITASTPVLNLTSTFNNAAVTFTGILANFTDTASAAASLLMDLQVGGSSFFAFAKSGLLQITQGTNGFVTFGSGSSRVDIGSSAASVAQIRINGNARSIWQTTPSNVPAVSNGFGWNIAYLNLHNTTGSTTVGGFLTSEAANSISQVNGTNGQTFNIYNTFTSSTNHERGFLSWVSSEFRIGTEKGSGGGTARDIGFYRDGVQIGIIESSGIRSTGNISCASGNGIVVNNRSQFRSPADGQMRVTNNAGTDFTLFAFGAFTNLFPCLKRSSAMLECRLGDDSAFAAFGCEWLSITDGVTAPAAVTGRARIYIDTADGDLKVIFGDGTVKTIVTDT